MPTPENIDKVCIKLDDLIILVSQMDARLKIFIIDACKNVFL